VPFQREIDALVRDVSKARGAILLDFEGEAVVMSAASIPPYDLKVFGAYSGIFLGNVRRITRETRIGSPQVISIDGEAAHLLIEPLKDGYYLLLVLDRGAIVAMAKERLRICCKRIESEF
jgi:predicted regulator of Ras-like GTPase activity (Roadblock/LC7/MglB family)